MCLGHVRPVTTKSQFEYRMKKRWLPRLMGSWLILIRVDELRCVNCKATTIHFLNYIETTPTAELSATHLLAFAHFANGKLDGKRSLWCAVDVWSERNLLISWAINYINTRIRASFLGLTSHQASVASEICFALCT